MPQLDTATFFGQVTWLVIVFGVLYRATRGEVLPKVSRIVKMRSKKRDRTRVDATQYDGERTAVDNGYSMRLGKAANQSHGLLQETVEVQSNWRKDEVSKRNHAKGMKEARTGYRGYRMQAKLADVYVGEALSNVGKKGGVKKVAKKVSVGASKRNSVATKGGKKGVVKANTGKSEAAKSPKTTKAPKGAKGTKK